MLLGELTLLAPAGIAVLGSGFARSARFPVLSLVRRVRGGRTVRILRILPESGFQFFHPFGQLGNELMLLQDQRPYSGRRLFPVLFADWKTVGKILHRHPGTLQFRLLFALYTIFQSPLHENPGVVPLIMPCLTKKNPTPPEGLRFFPGSDRNCRTRVIDVKCKHVSPSPTRRMPCAYMNSFRRT